MGIQCVYQRSFPFPLALGYEASLVGAAVISSMQAVHYEYLTHEPIGGAQWLMVYFNMV